MESTYGIRDNAAPPAIAFVKDVASLYHRNIWLFWKMLLPAAVFGYFVVFLATDRATDILSRLPRDAHLIRYHMAEILEAGLLRYGGYTADWLLYCFAFAGIVAAVDELQQGKQPAIEACFMAARERLSGFLGLSLALWLVSLVAIAIWMALLIFLVVVLGPNRLWSSPFIGMVIFLPIWVVSRFGLAIPAFVLEKSSIRKAFFRSDELTKGCWTILAILLLESIGGSYLVYLLIHWLFRQAAIHGVGPSWIANLGLPLGLLIGFVLEPHMFIGFALLYVRRSSQPTPEMATNAMSMG